MIHKQMASGRWQKFTIFEQMANIGSEVGRALNWKEKSPNDSQMAFSRGLELLDLTIADPKNIKRLKELLRLRETLADYFVFDNEYLSSKNNFNNYFYSFNYAARLGR